MNAALTLESPARVGVVETGVTAGVAAAVTEAGLTVEQGPLAAVSAADPDLLVADTPAALSAIARADTGVPVLAVGDVEGVGAVTVDRLPAVFDTLLAEGLPVVSHPLLAVTVDGSPVGDAPLRALFDVTLVTAEPARISGFGVHRQTETLGTLRADGMVVATAAGTYGYASSIGAPTLSAGIETVAVTPIACFTTEPTRWVVPPAGLTLTVERDEGDVSLVVDGRPIDRIPLEGAVGIEPAGTLEMVDATATPERHDP